jgi:hypothetical protein
MHAEHPRERYHADELLQINAQRYISIPNGDLAWQRLGLKPTGYRLRQLKAAWNAAAFSRLNDS